MVATVTSASRSTLLRTSSPLPNRRIGLFKNNKRQVSDRNACTVLYDIGRVGVTCGWCDQKLAVPEQAERRKGLELSRTRKGLEKIIYNVGGVVGLYLISGHSIC